MPCPYYFIHKISQFVNKKQIINIVDLGSGFGRITNYLAETTQANILGYEIDKEAFNFSIKNSIVAFFAKYATILIILSGLLLTYSRSGIVSIIGSFVIYAIFKIYHKAVEIRGNKK